MKVIQLIALFVVSLLGACSKKEQPRNRQEGTQRIVQYAHVVKDSFHISIQVPLEYGANPGKEYPTIVVLDANLYFPIMASIMHQYEMVGLLPPAIVVGVGYKSFPYMDSLRTRDYLFPAALPSDEMSAPGGGENFYNYITQQLLPTVDSTYRTDVNDRTLLGHSFGGYFVLYSLLHQSTLQRHDFRNFISASPSLWYHDFYLNKLPTQLTESKASTALFLAAGELEDSTWSLNPVKRLAADLAIRQSKDFHFKSMTFSNLDHMDVPVLTFTKGLQEFLLPKQE